MIEKLGSVVISVSYSYDVEIDVFSAWNNDRSDQISDIELRGKYCFSSLHLCCRNIVSFIE